jgi:Protein of unknown function (DUF1579)
MKRATIIVIFAVLASGVFVTAQGPSMPAPGPEVKKLDYFAGNWRATGDLKPSPMGPGGKFSEVIHSEWMPGHYFLVEHTTTSGVIGHLVEIAYLGYDPRDKSYSYDAFNSMGEAEHAKGSVEGDTWTWTSTENMGGKMMKGRFTITVASATSYSFKFEVAPEGGGDYSTVVEGKATKVLAPKSAKGAAGATTK